MYCITRHSYCTYFQKSTVTGQARPRIQVHVPKLIRSPLNLQLSESINKVLESTEQLKQSEGQKWKLMQSYLKWSLLGFSLLPAGLTDSVNALSTLEWGISVLRKMSLFFTRSVWGHFRESHCESIRMAVRHFSPGISLLKKLRNCGKAEICSLFLSWCSHTTMPRTHK